MFISFPVITNEWVALDSLAFSSRNDAHSGKCAQSIVFKNEYKGDKLMISMKNLLFPSFLMNRKQIVTTLSLGLMSLTLLLFAGCDRFDLGMIDNNRDESDTVDPNLVRANTMFGFKLLNRMTASSVPVFISYLTHMAIVYEDTHAKICLHKERTQNNAIIFPFFQSNARSIHRLCSLWV